MKLANTPQRAKALRSVSDTAALRPIATPYLQPSISLSPSDVERGFRGIRALAVGIIALCAGTGFCGSAKITDEREISTAPTNKPVVVHVVDFDLDVADIKSEKGLLPAPPKLPGLLGDTLPLLPGSAKDPQKLARELVNQMSDALVKDLNKDGFTARRLTSTNDLPPSGWLVRGVFTTVNQGNQLQRAVIGFGKGRTDLQVLVDVADLSQGAPRDFYELMATATSGKLPGAGPMIVLCPAGAAARFVIAGKDLNRNVKQTAAQIAKEVGERAGEAPRGTSEAPRR